MKGLPKTPVSNVYNARLSSVNVSMLYSFMNKRISRGYSTAETSFLMGYTTDYIRQKEELKNIGFSFDDMHGFIHAIEENSLRGFIHNYEEDNEDADYELSRTIQTSWIDLKMMRITENGSRIPIFHLIEENPDYIRYTTSEKESKEEVNAILNVLFEGRLFYTPQTPLNIFKRCRSAFGSETLAPRHILSSLTEMTRKKDFPRLRRIRSKDYGCMYEKIFE